MIERISQEIGLLNGIRISNSVLNVFIFNRKKVI